MAHNLEIRNEKASFVAVGQKAWHGLGVYVENAMTAKEAMELGGLDYVVEKRELFTNTGIRIPDHKAIIRTDYEDVLGIVTNSYEIIQNSEAFEFFDSIIDRGEAVYQTAGVLGKGEKIFITAKLPEDILVNGEKVENYILLTSGHDGKSAIQAGFTSIRVVCNNTLNAALKGMQNKTTIMHFKNAKEKLQMAAKVMGMASKYTVQLNDVFNSMANVKISDSKLREYIEAVMKPRNETINKETFQAEYSKRHLNKINEIMEYGLNHHTQTTDAAKNTVCGAYNAITGWYGWCKDYKTQEDKMNDLYFKNGSRKIQEAFDLALNMM